jgi:hypothetical protein
VIGGILLVLLLAGALYDTIRAEIDYRKCLPPRRQGFPVITPQRSRLRRIRKAISRDH